jgi:hypothetical protein
MIEVLRLVFGWILGNVLSFLLILAILVVGYLGVREYREFNALTEELADRKGVKGGLEEYGSSFRSAVVDRVNAAKGGSQDSIRRAIQDIDREIQDLRAVRQRRNLALLLVKRPVEKALADALKEDLQLRGLEHARNYLQQIRSISDAETELDRMRETRVQEYRKREARRVQRDRAEAGLSFFDTLYPWSERRRELARLNREYDEQVVADRRAYESEAKQRQVVEGLKRIGRYQLPQAALAPALEPLQRRLEELEANKAGHWLQRALDSLADVPLLAFLWTAAVLTLSIMLLPTAIKLILYFLVAPWAARRAPLRLLPAATGAVRAASPDAGHASAVSMPLVLYESEELLIRPEYLQSSPLRARKRTQWLLDTSIPFASLTSGLYLLTRVEPSGGEPVVISATTDPLSEIAVLSLGEGAAFVCQPRSLVGVVQSPAKPVRITRHWRLGHLQSWVTLQLRFLVFHGPGQLILQGCRGVRIETAQKERLINQAATVGFSANLLYANSRCETFVSYWSGWAELFNDLFQGNDGVYVYEEMPDLRRHTGIRRQVRGFSDAVLKVFGI